MRKDVTSGWIGVIGVWLLAQAVQEKDTAEDAAAAAESLDPFSTSSSAALPSSTIGPEPPPKVSVVPSTALKYVCHDRHGICCCTHPGRAQHWLTRVLDSLMDGAVVLVAPAFDHI